MGEIFVVVLQLLDLRLGDGLCGSLYVPWKMKFATLCSSGFWSGGGGNVDRRRLRGGDVVEGIFAGVEFSG
jgi:hypothetical protein